MGIRDKVKGLAPHIKGGLAHYPVTYALTLTVTVLAIILNEIQWMEHAAEPWIIRILIALIPGIPASMCVSAFFHYRDRKARADWILWIGLAILLPLMFLWLFDHEKTSTAMKAAAAVAFFAALYISIPALRGKAAMEVFVVRLLKTVVINGFYAHVLFGGLALITASANRLFDLNFSSRVYANLYIGVIGVVFSILILSDIWKDRETEFPKVFEKLNTFVLMPLLSAYTLVLYLYFIRILVRWDIPDNVIGNMVLWYSLIGTGSLLAARSASKDYRFTRLFRTWFRFLLLVPLGMLFFSMGIRVMAYGITEARYFTLAAGIWVLFTLLFTLGRKPRTVAASIALAAVAFLSSMSPLNAFDVSVWSQNRILSDLVNRHQVETNGMTVLPEDLPREELNRMFDIVTYFRQVHAQEDIDLPADFVEREFRGIYPSEPHLFSKFIQMEPVPAILDIRGYDYAVESHFRYTGKEWALGDITVAFDEAYTVMILRDGRELYREDIQGIVEGLFMQIGNENWEKSYYNLAFDQMVFLRENEWVRVKIILYAASAMWQNHQPVTQSVEYTLLFSMK